jgi:uncharacterized protein YkwD
MITKRLHRSLVGTVLAVAALTAPAHAFADSSKTNTQAVAGKVTKQEVAGAVAHLLGLINTTRATHHLAPLTLDRTQSACSKQHSLHMFQLKTLTHDQFPADICIAHTYVGENVGSADGEPVSALSTINQLMMDEGPCPHTSCPGAEFSAHGHYVNIMDKHFTKVGIGVVVRDGTTWVTENFAG